jgi:two-component system, NarL family, response regulator DesR
MSAIRVVVAEDQTMVLGALAALLELNADIKVVAQAGDGRLALRGVEDARPDVLITDIKMPNMTGLELAAEIKARGIGTRVIILTTFARAGYLRRAMDAGARCGACIKACESWTRNWRRKPGAIRIP